MYLDLGYNFDLYFIDENNWKIVNFDLKIICLLRYYDPKQIPDLSEMCVCVDYRD